MTPCSRGRALGRQSALGLRTLPTGEVRLIIIILCTQKNVRGGAAFWRPCFCDSDACATSGIFAILDFWRIAKDSAEMGAHRLPSLARRNNDRILMVNLASMGAGVPLPTPPTLLVEGDLGGLRSMHLLSARYKRRMWGEPRYFLRLTPHSSRAKRKYPPNTDEPTGRVCGRGVRGFRGPPPPRPPPTPPPIAAASSVSAASESL